MNRYYRINTGNYWCEKQDRIRYAEFLLQGDAKQWWKMEKHKMGGNEVNWEAFKKVFLRRYFSKSVSQQFE